jgi:hypothetical protein
MYPGPFCNNEGDLHLPATHFIAHQGVLGIAHAPAARDQIAFNDGVDAGGPVVEGEEHCRLPLVGNQLPLAGILPVSGALGVAAIALYAEGPVVIDLKLAVGAEIDVGDGAGGIVVDVRGAGVVHQLAPGDEAEQLRVVVGRVRAIDGSAGIGGSPAAFRSLAVAALGVAVVVIPVAVWRDEEGGEVHSRQVVGGAGFVEKIAVARRADRYAVGAGGSGERNRSGGAVNRACHLISFHRGFDRKIAAVGRLHQSMKSGSDLFVLHRNGAGRVEEGSGEHAALGKNGGKANRQSSQGGGCFLE